MKPTRDELEFGISQYIDGTLPPLERAALEERLAVDADARAMLEQYRSLDDALRREMPAPQVQWDRLGQSLSNAITREEAPIQHYRLGSWGTWSAIAAAAMIALVSGVFYFAQRSETPSRGAAIAVVVGPQIERTQSQVAIIADVAIGPAPTWSESWRYAETVISRPAVVLIDRAVTRAHDNEPVLY